MRLITNTLVLDNGGYTLKAGLVDSSAPPTSPPAQPRVITNCIARDRTRKIYVASELSRCKDFGEIALRRPVEKGFIVDWEAQREIWEREFFDADADAATRCDPSESRLILAEPSGGLPALQMNCDQIVFEEFQFASYYRGIGAFLPTAQHAVRSRRHEFASNRSHLDQVRCSIPTETPLGRSTALPNTRLTRRYPEAPPRSCSWWM